MTPGAIGKGTLFRQTVGSDIPLQEATIEVIEYAWPGVFSLTETSEVGTTQTRLILETAPDGTTLTLIKDVQFSGWLLRILACVIFLQARMRNASPMGRLKAYIEDRC